jgi:hypothetical protein
MFMSVVFERFVKQAAISVMARATMQHALSSEPLDALFNEQAEQQYARDLLFSSVVDIMGVVVAKIQPSVHGAFQSVKDTFPVSVTSLYNKLNSTEPKLTNALVSHTASRLERVIVAMGGQMPALLPGYRVRILDGNHLAATERRLEVLRGSIAGPLPGHALVVLDPELMLATHMIACEDGHAQERSLSEEILGLVEPNDVWIADRNFCTASLLAGMAKRKAFYVIRRHANMTIVSEGKLRKCGRTDTGEVLEQSVTLKDDNGGLMKVRRIVIRLDKPTRDGDTEMSILTNLPKKAACGITVAELYRKRWSVETMFQSLTQMFKGEIEALAYPRAALLGFAVALSAYNIFSTVQAALRGTFGIEKVEKEVSGYYIANEVRAVTSGMQVALEPDTWDVFESMEPDDLAHEMLEWAARVDLSKYKRHPRGPKKPVPKRTRHANKTHVSTARLLAQSKKR